MGWRFCRMRTRLFLYYRLRRAKVANPSSLSQEVVISMQLLQATFWSFLVYTIWVFGSTTHVWLVRELGKIDAAGASSLSAWHWLSLTKMQLRSCHRSYFSTSSFHCRKPCGSGRRKKTVWPSRMSSSTEVFAAPVSSKRSRATRRPSLPAASSTTATHPQRKPTLRHRLPPKTILSRSRCAEWSVNITQFLVCRSSSSQGTNTNLA
jgi:hypothetical protein